MELATKEKYASLFEEYGGLLTQSQRQVLQLYLFEDLSNIEIADVLATTRQASHDAIQKGLKRLDEIASKVQK